MAENLRYAPQRSIDSCSESVHLTKDSAIWAQYGHHYSWLSAMNVSCDYEDDLAFIGENPPFQYPHRGACPKGWHIPSFDEWKILLDEAKDVRKLLSTSWIFLQNKGTDEYGFNLLPHQQDENVDAFIMSDEVSEQRCNTIIFENYTQGIAAKTSTTWKWGTGMYIRCLMDEPHPTHTIYE